MDILQIISAFLMGPLDRARGSSKYSPIYINALDGFLYGIITSITLWGLDVPFLFSFVYFPILFIIGESFGYTEPWTACIHGKDMQASGMHWWQKGDILRTNPWIALVFRGFLWGAPTLFLMYWWPSVAIFTVAMMIAMPLSAWIVRYHKDKLKWVNKIVPIEKGPWDLGETLRGWICGIIVCMFAL